MLFAAVGLLLGGIDDLAIDILYLCRTAWRRLTVYTRHRPMTTASLPKSTAAGQLAIFIPAWKEANVIGPMLRAALSRWGEGDYRIFVGCYPNDPDTLNVVRNIAAGESRVISAVTANPGPTTKADCLNTLWQAMLMQEATSEEYFKAVILHDAEQVVTVARFWKSAKSVFYSLLPHDPDLRVAQLSRGSDLTGAVAAFDADELSIDGVDAGRPLHQQESSFQLHRIERGRPAAMVAVGIDVRLATRVVA